MNTDAFFGAWSDSGVPRPAAFRDSLGGATCPPQPVSAWRKCRVPSVNHAESGADLAALGRWWRFCLVPRRCLPRYSATVVSTPCAASRAARWSKVSASPNMAQRSVRPTVRWATAAATLTLLPPSNIAVAAGVFVPSWSASASNSSGMLSRASPELASQTPSTESRDGTSPLALGARVLFVAGRRTHVRFRIDLRDGTLSTPSVPKLLEGVVDVAVGERTLFLCQTASSVGSALNIVGFDLGTGVRIHDAGPKARAVSMDPRFCPRGSPTSESPSLAALAGVPNI